LVTIELLEVDLVERVVVKYVIGKSFFLKEVSIDLHVLFTGVDPLELASPLVLEHTLFDHRIICSLLLGLWHKGKGASSLVVQSASSIERLLLNFGQESLLDNSSFTTRAEELPVAPTRALRCFETSSIAISCGTIFILLCVE